ncbi:MAG: DUF4115 domain-containing protein [Chloroflexi bacterium]|nr:DUF4115 domain-containing protein [Chloroflexota bacterium]
MSPESRSPGLGSLLRAAREGRSITIAQAEQQTRIPRHHLEALEDEQFTRLPPPVFTRGLVRNYAVYLGLDPRDAQRMVAEIDPRPPGHGVQREVEDRPVLSGSTIQITRIGLTLIVAILLGAALYQVVPRYQSILTAAANEPAPTLTPTRVAPTATVAPQTRVPTATTPPPPTATPAPAATPRPTGAPTAPASVPSTARGVTIEARTLGRVWTQVEVDGQTVFSGILQSGEHRTWRGETRIIMHVGNGALVELTHNGQAIGKAGGAEEVVRREWLAGQ